ncbi:MAG: hypothetical protein PHX51_00395 [Clostridia bacterium]|nr:hypothetical protein [Clostridia bacterium]
MSVIAEYIVDFFEFATDGKFTLDVAVVGKYVFAVFIVLVSVVFVFWLLLPIIYLIQAGQRNRRLKVTEQRAFIFAQNVLRDCGTGIELSAVSADEKSVQKCKGKKFSRNLDFLDDKSDEVSENDADSVLPSGNDVLFIPDVHGQNVSGVSSDGRPSQEGEEANLNSVSLNGEASNDNDIVLNNGQVIACGFTQSNEKDSED